MSQLFVSPFTPAFTATGLLAGGARLSFFLTGTTTPATVYADEAMTVPLGSFVTANIAGQFPQTYLDPTLVYRVRLTTALGLLVSEVDPFTAATGAEQIVFRQAAAGAVPRTIQQELRETVRPSSSALTSAPATTTPTPSSAQSIAWGRVAETFSSVDATASVAI